MILFLLISVFTITKILSLICSKACSNVLTSGGVVGNAIYIFLVSLISCVTYSAFTGFTLEFDKTTMLLSLVLALASVGSLLISLVIYRIASVSGVNVIMTSLSLVTSAVIGFTIFSETVTFVKLIRIVLMILAGLFVYFDNVTKEKSTEKKSENKKWLLLAIIICLLLINCYTTIQSKLLSTGTLVKDVNTFFFMTNVYMLLGALAVIIFMAYKKTDEIKKNLVLLKPKNILTMTGNTFGSNISVLLNVLILARMDLSVFTMISSALGILCAALVSLIFREKLGIFAKLSILLSLVVTVI